jgi:hypothetical protein
VLSIVYSSRASRQFSGADLEDLLSRSRANNDRLGLSGMLLFREGRFLQILEGPSDVLSERYAIIAKDPRHTHVTTLLEEETEHRFFGHWSMRYETLSDEEAAAAPGYREGFDDVDPEGGSITSLADLRELIRWFQQRPATTE